MELSALNGGTKRGFFLGEGGERFWVVEGRHFRRAVRLDSSERGSAFSVTDLGQVVAWKDGPITPLESLASGTWLGPVKLELGGPVEGAFYNRCDIIIATRFRIYLKVRGAHGRARNLVIQPYECDDWYPVYYPNWKLLLSVGDHDAVVYDSSADTHFFNDPERPKAEVQKSAVRKSKVPIPTPRLVWSAPTATEP